MDSFNFHNFEKYKEDEQSLLLQLSTPSQSNSSANSPLTNKSKITCQHSTSFQMWLRDQIEDQVLYDLDVNEFCSHYIGNRSDHLNRSDHSIQQKHITLDMSSNRVFQERLLNIKGNISPTAETVTVTESSILSLSRISEESQIIASEDADNTLKTVPNTITIELSENIKMKPISTHPRYNSIEQNFEDITIIQITQSDSQLPNGIIIEDATKLKKSVSPKERSSQRSKTIAMFQLANNPSPSKFQLSPKSARRQSQRVQRSSTLTDKDIHKIYETGIVRKAFVKTSKNRISQFYNQLITRNSHLTFEIKRNNKTHIYQRTIKVLYFNSPLFKKITVPKEITSCEFLHKAIHAFMKDDTLDQSLLKYQSYPLAYQLEGTEDDQVEEDLTQQSPYRKSYNQKDPPWYGTDRKNSDVSSFQKDLEFDSFEIEQMIERIPLEPGQRINFSQVYLVQQDINKYSESLQQLLKNEQFIIQIEDPQISKFYHLKASQQQSMRDLLDMMNHENSQIYTKQDYCLRLKFPCLNFAEQILPQKLLVHRLPIQWLEIVKVKIQQNPILPELKIQKTILQTDQPDVLKLSQLMNSFDKKTSSLGREPLDIAHMMKIYPTLYSQEEFNLLRIVGESKEPVILNIDFFEFHCTQTTVRQKSKRSILRKINNYFKQVLQYLIIEDYDYHQHRFKKFPLSKITSYRLEDDQLFVEYIKNQSLKKTLVFEIDPNFIKEVQGKQVVEKGKQKLQLVYGKLKFLMEQQRLGSSLFQ